MGRDGTATTVTTVTAGKDPERVKDYLLSAAAVVAATATYLTSATGGDAVGRTRTALLVLGAVLAGATVVIGALQQRRTQRRLRTAEQVAVDAEAELMLTLNG